MPPWGLRRETRELHAMNVSLLLTIWTLIVAASFAVSATREYDDAIETARIEARAHFNEIVNVRHWVATLGGVYAPITEDTRPSGGR